MITDLPKNQKPGPCKYFSPLLTEECIATVLGVFLQISISEAELITKHSPVPHFVVVWCEWGLSRPQVGDVEVATGSNTKVCRRDPASHPRDSRRGIGICIGRSYAVKG